MILGRLAFRAPILSREDDAHVAISFLSKTIPDNEGHCLASCVIGLINSPMLGIPGPLAQQVGPKPDMYSPKF